MGTNNVLVLGAGMMGAEIAYCCATAGYHVVMKDINREIADKGKEKIVKILERLISKGQIEAPDKEAIAGRVKATDKYDEVENVDLVIEAVTENYDIKSKVFRELSALIRDDCIVASNTSAISITKLATNLKNPQNFVGMHFFSPASVMKLVEVIPGLETRNEVVDSAMSFCRKIGKEPITIKKECVGFVVNRILNAIFQEAFRLLDEGIATPQDIDKAVRLGLGHPVGPFQLLDLLGNDLALSVFEILFNEYGERFRPSPLLKQKVFANHLGRKTKIGWFTYE